MWLGPMRVRGKEVGGIVRGRSIYDPVSPEMDFGFYSVFDGKTLAS